MKSAKPPFATLKTIVVENWTQLDALNVALSDNVFRGQSSTAWQPETSLARLFHSRCMATPEDWLWSEYRLLKAFKRRAHQYESNLPDADDTLSWLALMQHHGAPTRLLDFTYSFYIACYFALIDAEDDCAVWAVDKHFLQQLGSGLADAFHGSPEWIFRKQHEYGNHVLNCQHALGNERKKIDYNNQSLGVLMIEPERQNRRLAAQQGLLLAPLNIHRSFLNNLQSWTDVLTGSDSYWQKRPPVKKFILRSAMRETTLAHLTKMNITAETLFPGIDGFARSLKQIELHT